MATTRTWFGGTGSFNNPNDWSPAGVPQSGDTAAVQTGTVEVTDQTLTGVGFQLEGTSKATQPVLQLHNADLPSGISLTGPPGTLPQFGKIEASGSVLTSGVQVGEPAAAAGNLTIHIAQQSTFVNIGSIDTAVGATVIKGAPGSVFVNDGTVLSGDQSHGSGFVTIDTRVIGTGNFQVGPNVAGSEMEFGSNVAKSLNVLLAAGENFLGL